MYVCVETVMEKHFDRWTNGDILNAIYGHYSHLKVFVQVIKLNTSVVVPQANIKNINLTTTLILIAATSVLFICFLHRFFRFTAAGLSREKQTTVHTFCKQVMI